MIGHFVCLLLLVGMAAGSFANETALDRYIAKPDDAYRWELNSTISGDGYTGHVLKLTSQRWRSEEEVDRPFWTHWLTVITPDRVDHDTAMLYIGDGDNGDEVPTEVSARHLDFALKTNSVVAVLGMVPNQPLYFADSKRHGRYEDDLIAYSRVKFMVTQDEEWLARLPMVKSGVRAMDAVQEFLSSDDGGIHTVDAFVVAGGSKRAWTTWLVGIVDDRVSAIIPLVIDALNTEAITRHHYAAYGFFSKSLGDYVRHGLYPGLLGTPIFDRILEIEDPYMYRNRERLTIPKYVINASGDQYFLPDNSQFYFLDMPDEKHLRYVPNARHNLAGSNARESMLSFYQSVLHDTDRPMFTWKLTKDGPIVVTTIDKPIEVNLWQASNPDARDFRLDTIGKAWTKTRIRGDGNEYIGRVDKPDQGYTAFFVEVVFYSGFEYPFTFTTDVNVVPDVLPFSLDGVTEIELR
jgi:PhoPQ-activated pathogenicity-related protein